MLTGFTVTGGSGTVFSHHGLPEERLGGGIFILHSGAKVEYNKIIDNHITYAGTYCGVGAGIAVVGDPGNHTIIRSNNIRENRVTSTGSGQPGCAVILWSQESCLFEKNRVSNNHFYGGNVAAIAGGLYIGGLWNHQGPYVVCDNIISDNVLHTVKGGGGGVVINTCSPVLYNNVISDNRAGSWGGGGIWIYHNVSGTGRTEATLINNTITNNSATGIGGGILVEGSQAYVNVMNTIVWGNSSPSGLQIYGLSGGWANVRYSDVQGILWPGEGNIDADPLLVADSLSNASPCIGAGTLQYDFGGGVVLHSPPYDINGRMRPFPPGSNPDMGAWESKLDTAIVGIEPLPGLLPSTYALHQNYPNPFNPSTTIEFALPKSAFVTLTIYNVVGEKVTTLVSENLAAGSYKYQWEARGLASGVYFYRIETGSSVQTKKMLLLR